MTMSWGSLHQQLSDSSVWEQQALRLLPRAQLASTVCYVSEDGDCFPDGRPLATLSQSTDLSPGYRRRGECRKRKGLVDEGFYSPDSKQLITEEIVAARLGSLYLDQQSPCDANTDVVQDSGDVPMKNSVFIEDCGEDSGGESDYGSSDENSPAVELSKELKDSIKLCTESSLIPKKLVHKFNRPCMELVLWRPPSDFIQHVYNLKTDSHNEENNQQVSTSKEPEKVSSDFIEIDTEEAPWDSDEMEL